MRIIEKQKERKLISRLEKITCVLLLPLFLLLWWGVLPFLAPELPAIQYPLMALGAIISIAISLLAREALIALSDRLSGLVPAPITIYLWGGIPRSCLLPAREVRALFVAFFASLAVAAVFLLLFSRVAGPQTPLAFTAVALLLVLFNLLVAMATLLPVYPLAGGRIIVALVAAKSDHASAMGWARRLCLSGSIVLLALALWQGWGGAPLTALTMAVFAVHLAFVGITHARKNSP